MYLYVFKCLFALKKKKSIQIVSEDGVPVDMLLLLSTYSVEFIMFCSIFLRVFKIISLPTSRNCVVKIERKAYLSNSIDAVKLIYGTVAERTIGDGMRWLVTCYILNIHFVLRATRRHCPTTNLEHTKN